MYIFSLFKKALRLCYASHCSNIAVVLLLLGL